ncbi:MAG: PIG-L family deacetylase [Bacillus subtilis]|nr:PIG-L family deacetylase [Bacillus subtilis]
MSIALLEQMAPLPAIVDGKVFLFVGPHPDDIEIGCGATIANLRKRGKTIAFLITTDGSSGSSDATTDPVELAKKRLLEATDSAKSLGVEHVFRLDFPDGGVYSVVDLAVPIAQKIIAIQPDFVFAPDPLLPSEIHPDHLACGEAVKRAVFVATNPMVAKRHGLDPTGHSLKPIAIAHYFTHRANQIVPIDASDFEAQLCAIALHPSQYRESAPESHMLSQYLAIQKATYGAACGHSHADGYAVFGGVHQHCFPEVNRYTLR